MIALENCPGVLLRKVLFTALAGFGFLVVGVACFLFSRDAITLILSGLLSVFSMIRSARLYQITAKQQYETVEGVCIGVSARPFGKYLTVRIMDGDGKESTLKLGKQVKMKIGGVYRLHFKTGQSAPAGTGYFNAALLSDSLLGLEELGEFDHPG